MIDNTSGHGPLADIPPEAKRWNWGAFCLTWIWGIGNNTFIALLSFVPFVNIAIWFMLGAKGGEWAWRNKRWENVEAFRKSQRRWAQAGFAALISITLLGVAFFFFVTGTLKNSQAYKLAESTTKQNLELTEFLGTPMTFGAPKGKIQQSNSRATADLNFTVSGPRSAGEMTVTASRRTTGWVIDQLEFDSEDGERYVDLLHKPVSGDR